MPDNRVVLIACSPVVSFRSFQPSVYAFSLRTAYSHSSFAEVLKPYLDLDTLMHIPTLRFAVERRRVARQSVPYSNLSYLWRKILSQEFVDCHCSYVLRMCFTAAFRRSAADECLLGTFLFAYPTKPLKLGLQVRGESHHWPSAPLVRANPIWLHAHGV